MCFVPILSSIFPPRSLILVLLEVSSLCPTSLQYRAPYEDIDVHWCYLANTELQLKMSEFVSMNTNRSSDTNIPSVFFMEPIKSHHIS